MTEGDSSLVHAGGLADADPYTTVFAKRVSQEVVDQIRGLIVSKQLRPGDRLPSERTLAASMGVGRVTIREAMRVLEANGLLEIRVGARGGAVVTSPSLSRIEARLGELLRLASGSLREITAAMRAFEVGIVPIVVERITAQEVTDLREMTTSHRSASRFGQRGSDVTTTFHVQVAKCTHNRAIETLAHSLRWGYVATLDEAVDGSPPTPACDAGEHGDIVDAIASRDAALAKEIMRVHLDPALDVCSLSGPCGGAAAGEQTFNSTGGTCIPQDRPFT